MSLYYKKNGRPINPKIDKTPIKRKSVENRERLTS